jgi:hypothetical protein
MRRWQQRQKRSGEQGNDAADNDPHDRKVRRTGSQHLRAKPDPLRQASGHWNPGKKLQRDQEMA